MKDIGETFVEAIIDLGLEECMGVFLADGVMTNMLGRGKSRGMVRETQSSGQSVYANGDSLGGTVEQEAW